MNMPIRYLSVITEPAKVFDTGNKPLLVTCNDLNDYVCKHNYPSSTSPFNEYIASSFLEFWKIPTPDFAFISPGNEYLNRFAIENDMQPRWFSKTCFASYYMKDTKEIDLNFNLIRKEILRKINFWDLLKIALFDIWIGNEDRTYNNPNMLFKPSASEPRLYAIDHGSIFNNNSYTDLIELTINDTILRHDLFQILFKKKIINHDEIIFDLFENFTIFVDDCKNSLERLLQIIPSDWEIDIDLKRDFLIGNLFNEDWLDKVKKAFELHYYYYLRQ